MSSLETAAARTPVARPRRLFALAVTGLLALSVAGCFRPMYGDSAPGQQSSLRDQLGDVEVVFVGGRVGNEIRNDLIFELTGGSGNPVGAPYRLEMVVTSSTVASIVDSISGLPETEIVSVDVQWQLRDSADPKKPPLARNATLGKASIDSGYQRFARARAIRDAENRAAKVAAEMIRTQLASYFLTRKPGS